MAHWMHGNEAEQGRVSEISDPEARIYPTFSWGEREIGCKTRTYGDGACVHAPSVFFIRR
ncbi:hypothetical protein KSZ_67890 [Dictyobacter formicarum]|uniref:Uncharacterized protein n=1 Tax=Dictyobacter formicarum TaxID=2778368 RepID=A0ABQ3VSI5_9CHLR|nr:hypothetical protein KSZ_67890 [Dictyobacter formicarum]